MKTTVITTVNPEAPYVFHVLAKDETWADYGMEQPNPWFSHIVDPPFHCEACWLDMPAAQRSR